MRDDTIVEDHDNSFEASSTFTESPDLQSNLRFDMLVRRDAPTKRKTIYGVQ
jgi:hypothetical protein